MSLMIAEFIDTSSPALKNKRRTVRLLPLLLLALCSCSFQNFIMIVNEHGENRQVSLQFGSPQAGTPIFSARKLGLYAMKDNDVDFSSHVPLNQTESPSLTVTIPARSALCIAVLRNETFSSSDQKFINGRVFNLKQIKSGSVTITKTNFGAHFRRTNFGAAWYLP